MPATAPVPTTAEPEAADRHSTADSIPEPVAAEPANRDRRAARHG